MTGIGNSSKEWDAAVEYASQADYGGSVEALALSNAFHIGALNQGATSDIKLVAAFLAGMAWNVKEKLRLKNVVEQLRRSPVAVSSGERPIDGNPMDDRPKWLQEYDAGEERKNRRGRRNR